MSKILIIEDDSEIAMLERDYLEIEGFETTVIADGEAAAEEALRGGYDLLLLDLMLPGCNGYDICRRVRDRIDVPILMVTARTDSVDKIRGLGLGADDYIAKPFGMMELLSRIRALLRRTETENGTLRCGILEVDPGQHIVRVRGQETILTQKEFEVLCLLLRNPGQVLSREQLIENVWGYAFTGESRTVDVHVRTLRQKLGEAGAYIETVRGYGYKISPVN